MLKDRAKSLRDRVTRRVRETLDQASARASARTESLTSIPKSSSELEAADKELPVVARLVVEIRSDGSRTVARGAMKDELGGEQVAIVARGNSPLELAAQLTKSLVTMPLTAGQLARAMLNARRAPPSSEGDD